MCWNSYGTKLRNCKWEVQRFLHCLGLCITRVPSITFNGHGQIRPLVHSAMQTEMRWSHRFGRGCVLLSLRLCCFWLNVPVPAVLHTFVHSNLNGGRGLVAELDGSPGKWTAFCPVSSCRLFGPDARMPRVLSVRRCSSAVQVQQSKLAIVVPRALSLQ